MIDAFEIARNVVGPVLIHVLTEKGKGYEPAEKDPTSFHGVGAFDIATGRSVNPGGLSYTKVFGRAMKKLADTNPKLIGITAAMIRARDWTASPRPIPIGFSTSALRNSTL